MLVKFFCWLRVLFLSQIALFYFLPQTTLAKEVEISSDPESHTQLPTLYLREGQKYPLEGVISQNAKVFPEHIASVHQTPEGLLLIGRHAGQAQLSLEANGKKVEINVLVQTEKNKRATSSWDLILQELKKIPGIRLSKLGEKTVIQGEILGRAAYQRILLFLQTFQKNLLVLALPGAGIKESLVEQVQSILTNRGLQHVHITHAANRFFLEGSVSTPPEVEQAYEIAQGIIPNIENHLPIPIRVDPTITIRVTILELSRQAHEVLGLSWPGSLRNILNISPTKIIFEPNWLVTLKHLSTEGHAKVLAEPMLSVKNGAHAELLAGGEIPIRITGHFENKVIWRNYGLKVKLHVAGISGKHIRTKIDTESSHLDEATAVDGVPGIRTNRMSTEIDAVEGLPVLLTGLFQASTSKDIERIPMLGHIPILGELFKSRRFRENESELLVALLPQFGAQLTSFPLQSLHGLEFEKRWKILD